MNQRAKERSWQPELASVCSIFPGVAVRRHIMVSTPGCPPYWWPPWNTGMVQAPWNDDAVNPGSGTLLLREPHPLSLLGLFFFGAGSWKEALCVAQPPTLQFPFLTLLFISQWNCLFFSVSLLPLKVVLEEIHPKKDITDKNMLFLRIRIFSWKAKNLSITQQGA